MPTEWSRLLARLSRTDLQKLLETKADIERLEARRSVLLKELAGIEKNLKQLVAGEAGRGRPAAGRVAQGGGTKQKAKKKAAPALRAKGGAAGRKKTSGGAVARMKLEDLAVAVLRENGEPMPFKMLLDAIVKDRRFKSRSKSFENVLRRTLSTSKCIQRKERGVYGI